LFGPLLLLRGLTDRLIQRFLQLSRQRQHLPLIPEANPAIYQCQLQLQFGDSVAALLIWFLRNVFFVAQVKQRHVLVVGVENEVVWNAEFLFVFLEAPLVIFALAAFGDVFHHPERRGGLQRQVVAGRRSNRPVRKHYHVVGNDLPEPATTRQGILHQEL